MTSAQTDGIRYPWFSVGFRSPLDLDAVCDLLSRKLFLGIPFQECNSYQEVPARMLPGKFLGLWIDVRGYGGAGGYHLNIEPVFNMDWGEVMFDNVPVYFPEYMMRLLATVEGIKPIPQSL